jgi:endonuclease/exonuclease/phosphatase family metal-dependent hydrolase
MLIDGNDDRGIDVGLLSRYPISALRTHVYDTDDVGTVFSRDCCEYHLDVGDGRTLVVLVNHLKSKGYGSADDPIGAKRRRRQATRIAEIYNALIADGHALVAVVGDLNDTPDSDALQPLLGATALQDISKHNEFDPGPRAGTFKGEKNQIDYVLLSPDLFATATGGGIFRKGVWRGNRTKNPWEIYSTLTADVHAASDHAAIWAEIDL